MILENFKILSIQSHVVSGYVGNKCCILPLQILGNDVDFINSVQFSNHTSLFLPYILRGTGKYDVCKGQVLNAQDLKDLFEGLEANNLCNYSSIITGYIGSKTFLEEVCNIVKNIKQRLNPNALFYCDPVMGDNGKMYVPSELLDVYRNKVLPLADVLFPNQYEAELLTGIEIRSEKDMMNALAMFHKKGVKTAVVTSSNLGPSDVLFGFVSKIDSDGCVQRFRMEIPKFHYDFVGTGDLFVSLFLGWSLKFPNNLQEVCARVIGSMQVVLKKTVVHYEGLKSKINISECQGLELKLVDCILDLMNPQPFDKIIKLD